MTTSAKSILMATVMIVGCIILCTLGHTPKHVTGAAHINLVSGTHTSIDTKESPAVNASGEDKVEDEECPVCYTRNIKMMKPFKCRHVICIECFTQWAESRADTSHYETIGGFVTSVENTAICPVCREKLK